MNYLNARAGALAFAIALGAVAAPAQRAPAPVDATQQPAQRTAEGPKPAPAPASVQAKYEGGVLGYAKQGGFLAFDDLNRRLVFRNKEQRELFSLSFDALLAAWPDTKSRRSTAGQVIASTAPYGLGLPALLMRSKSRYLVVQYRDPDTRGEGVTSFKINDKALLASVLQTLADKAQLTARGDAFVRRTDATPTTTRTSGP